MRLIDADALKKKADMRGRCLRPLVTAFQMCVTVHDIDDAPTIDAVHVVRCAKCVFRSGSGRCVKSGLYMSDDGFCSYGKDGDGDAN